MTSLSAHSVPPTARRRTAAGLAAALACFVLAPGIATASGGTTTAPTDHRAAAQAVATLGDPVAGLPDLDVRGATLPSATQRAAVDGLGAIDVRWNRFGTPASILPADGVLASGYSTDPDRAPAAARAWLRAHGAVFGLSAAQVDSLELVNNAAFAQSPARAVLFRQTFGTLTPALASMVTVGVSGGRIMYVSSSLAKADGPPPAATLSPVQGWLKAAANVGRTVDAGAVADIVAEDPSEPGGFTQLAVPGFPQLQQARLRALALADGSVRPVIEANVVDVRGANSTAYTLMVDAVTGRVLVRQNKVESYEGNEGFQGAITASSCGPKHAFDLPDGNTKNITATATAVNPANDIVVKLFGPDNPNALLTSGDLLTSPETVTYAPGTTIAAGTYYVQVCPFSDPTTPIVPPYNYVVAVRTSNSSSPAATSGPQPRWRFFTTNPSLTSLGSAKPGNSVIGCWFTRSAGCSYPLGTLKNIASRGPWDTNPGNGATTGTTTGNNAQTREAWASPLTPGGTAQAPFSPQRSYTTPFTDAWNNSKCDPAQLRPAGNDIIASVTNLFVTHNLMHDWSYYLGFTEENYNLQQANFGAGGTEGDPEIGNAQAGALTGGQPTYLGRDNANQVTLQDGVPGITNQYLFQPIAGAFYAPCTDGAMDFGIVGHEYTHAISNRMVGGPDESLTSEQGGAMGESWSDLDAAEYQFAHGFSNGGNIWAVGVYATQNKRVAIRDYAINKNPLNYSDYGFDSTGPEVHADGEIWNGTQWSVRQALVKKWNQRYPYSDRSLQKRCAVGRANRSPLPARLCPGNRRWIQLVFDSFLLQQGATSMLDARDAMLAADRMRFGGKDLTVMWKAFAERGMGKGAHVKNADDNQPTPSFATPKGRNGKVTFASARTGKVYVGQYEARVTPIADTSPKSKLSHTAPFVPGRYQMLFVSSTGGFKRFSMTVAAGQHQTIRLETPRNLAARSSGARVIRATAGSRNPAALIDGTERTNWGGVTNKNVDASHPFVAVDLAGRTSTIRRFNVSAFLNPAPPSPTDVPLAADPDSGSRFTALRRFALEVCTRKCATSSARWKRVFTSGANAFPGALPRPVAPDLRLRSFSLKKGVKASAVRLVVLENQCTGFRGYSGEQDHDPTNDTDCKSASDRGTIVHVAELQVF